MQSLINMAIRTLFFTFIRLPFIIVASLLPKKIKIPVPGGSPPVQQEGGNAYGDPMIAPTSCQGQTDRKNYERILNEWEALLGSANTMNNTIQEMRDAVTAPEHEETLRQETGNIQGQFTRMKEKASAEGGYLHSLDRLEARNSGMRELKARRKQLQDWQDAIETTLWATGDFR